MADLNTRSSALRRRRARTARLDFAGIEIVGALLTPDIVAKVAAFDAGQQTKEGYGIPLGLDPRDEIARYYRMGEALWGRFIATRTQGAGASTLFVTGLLRQCFGFDSLAARPWLSAGERDYPVGHAALDGRVPVVIAPAAAESSRRAGVRKRSAAAKALNTFRRRTNASRLGEKVYCWRMANGECRAQLAR